jgi:hypothetical protein
MLFIYSGLLTIVFIPIIYCQTTYDLLDSLRFLNKGSISSSDVYEYQYEAVGYTEPENVTRENYAWVETSAHPYLYQFDSTKPKECNLTSTLNQTDLRGGDLIAIIPSAPDPSECVTLCCDYMSCVSWSYAAVAKVDFINRATVLLFEKSYSTACP